MILGAFAAGAILKIVDRDEMMTHAAFRTKLDAVGYGDFIPVFFVASGLRFDLDALTESASSLARVPLFVAALLVVRGVPALLYRPLVWRRETIGSSRRPRCPSSSPGRRSAWSSARSPRRRVQHSSQRG